MPVCKIYFAKKALHSEKTEKFNTNRVMSSV